VAEPGMRPNQFDRKDISVEQMRDLRNEVDRQPYHVERRFQVLHTNHDGRPYVAPYRRSDGGRGPITVSLVVGHDGEDAAEFSVFDAVVDETAIRARRS
jgi:hypothetical protein